MVTNNAWNSNIPVQETLGGTGQSTYATGDILIATGANTLGKTALPTYPGVPLFYNASTALWFNPLTDIWFQDHFISQSTASWLGWASSGGNGGAVSTVAGTATNPGQVQATTSTSTNGAVTFRLGQNDILFGGGRMIMNFVINLNQLSTVTEQYGLRVGFIDRTGSTDNVNGAYFQYTNDGSGTGENSANWAIKTSNNSTRTFQASNVAVTAAAWHRLTIDMNAAANSCAFYVDNVQLNVSPLTTNIPTATGRETGIGWSLYKLAGTTATTLNFDYFSFWGLQTNPISS